MSGEVIDGYPSEPSNLADYFEPLFFEPIVSWERDIVNVLSEERNREELEWLVRLLIICEPYPVEDLVPMDEALPFTSGQIDRYVSYLIDPHADIYEYEDRYYIGPEANYGFEDSDFICLDDEDMGLPGGLPPGLWAILFPPPQQ